MDLRRVVKFKQFINQLSRVIISFLSKVDYITVLILFSSLFLSCRQEKSRLEVKELQISAFTEEYPDSSFFSNIKCMYFYNNFIYALDVKRRDIAVFDENFQKFHLIGKPGEGPKELGYPATFYIESDTIYVLDGGSRSVKSFFEGEFINSYRLSSEVGTKHFFVANNNLYFSSPLDTSLYTVISKYGMYQGKYKRFGKPFIFENGNETIMRNKRSLLLNGNFMYAVSDNLPIIEKYDIETLRKPETFDLSDIPIVKSNLSFINNQKKRPKSYYVFLEDAYIDEYNLYLLCANLGAKYKVNTILVIALSPAMHLKDIWVLPNNIYDAFCISSNFLYVFNSRNNLIEKIKIIK